MNQFKLDPVNKWNEKSNTDQPFVKSNKSSIISAQYTARYR